MSNISIPPSLCDLLIKLEFLSQINRNQKPCFNDFSIVDGKSWFSTIKRTLTGENRKSMMLQIDQIILLAIDAINEYRDSEYLGLLINTLAKAKTGICNLITTYQ